jgi:hypothetical protein
MHMALHDFWCQVCGTLLVDVNVPIALGARLGAPLHCDTPAAWMPQVGRMDASSGPGFTAFEARDSQNRPVLVDSLAKLRKIERQSEVDYRNGEGQPLVWRNYSNDASNKHVHALHPGWTGGQAPDPAWVKKNAAGLAQGAAVADQDYGPGIDDSTPSALSHLKD